jgi:hypothetical protein
MTTSEKFKVWLENVYISDKTGKPLTSGIQYVTGLNALNKKFNLAGEGIYDKNADLRHIRNLIDDPVNFHKDYSSHFNAFLKFRDYCVEVGDRNIKPLQRQENIFKKQQVEVAAVEVVIKHFESLDYIVISSEKDNVGWDLEARRNKELLLLEVKGLSGKVLSIEMSPNEYRKSSEFHVVYRLCIVTHALSKPELNTFQFDKSERVWKSSDGKCLQIEERIAARVFQINTVLEK